MIILQKTQSNELTLNINNNSRVDYSAYTLTFTHVVSQEVKSFTILTNSPFYGENDRYCEIVLDLSIEDLNYLGQYELQIYGDGSTLVYTGMALLNGPQEGTPFTEYISPNENNENYIYIQD